MHKTRINFLKIILLCLLLLSAGIFVYFQSGIIDNRAGDKSEKYIPSTTDNNPDISEQKNLEEERHSIVIPSRNEFSPLPNGSFLVSFYFRQTIPPIYNRRQKLIAHYEAEKKPYTGWAVAYRKLPASYRFELYLKDRDGSGGWFSFDAIDIRRDQWYAITFIVTPDSSVSLFINTVDDDFSSSGISKWLGGYSLEGINDFIASSRLQITSGRPKIGPFRGDVRGLSIFNLAKTVNKTKFQSYIREGPSSLIRQFPENCIISLLESETSASCKYSHQ